MDVREKLVELLQDEKNPVWRWFPNNASMMQLADYLVSHGVTVQEWIPVTERLPENIANRVLVVCERSNGVFYAHYEKPFWINLETDKPFISTVTHWMPMPNPPKGE